MTLTLPYLVLFTFAQQEIELKCTNMVNAKIQKLYRAFPHEPAHILGVKRNRERSSSQFF